MAGARRPRGWRSRFPDVSERPPKPLPRVRREGLGLAVRALLPTEKLKWRSARGPSYERELHDFLLTNFNGYTVSSGCISGHWADPSGNDEYGEHREYCVAIPSGEGIEALEVFLSTLAEELEEECILLEAGAEIRLVYRASEV